MQPTCADCLMSCWLWLCPSYWHRFSSHHHHCRLTPGILTAIAVSQVAWMPQPWFLRILFKSLRIVKLLRFSPSKPWKDMRELIRSRCCTGLRESFVKGQTGRAHNSFSFSLHKEKPLWWSTASWFWLLVSIELNVKPFTAVNIYLGSGLYGLFRDDIYMLIFEDPYRNLGTSNGTHFHKHNYRCGLQNIFSFSSKISGDAYTLTFSAVGSVV